MEHPKLFRGRRTPEGCKVVMERGGASRSLDPRRDLRNHSPAGFEWGYNGSGPAQLALAILAAVVMDDNTAQLCYQDFKSEVIAGLHKGGWNLSEDTVWRWYHFWCERHRDAMVPVPESDENGGVR